jgi:FecR protein
LTGWGEIAITPRVKRTGTLNSSAPIWTLAALALFSMGMLIAHAATPYSEATVTRIQNKVSYGEQKGRESVTRPAAVQDVVRATNFLLSENDSRAELQYPDGTIVRIGQNTVFSFEAESRTLSLSKGTLIFYVPKGQGGATIKTPSLTAAITGTVGKVGENTILIIEGSVKLVPSGIVVGAGQFARRNPDGTITVDFYTPGTEFAGTLMTFNGPLPPFREDLLAGGLKPDFNSLVTQETLDRTANQPGALNNFFPKANNNPPSPVDKTNPVVFVPPPKQNPPDTRIPARTRPSY